jgi:RHS repeat-associated protein
MYDSLNRIEQAYTNGTNWGETYSPNQTAPGVPPSIPGSDAWGNLTNRSGVTGKTLYEPLSVSAGTNNQLSGFGYDAAGNMTLNGSTAYTYDAENRLIATAGISYKYDGDGKRVEKCTEATNAPGTCATNATGTMYWTGTGSDPLAETDLAGNVLENYIFFNGRRIARRDPSTKAVHYYFSDHLGTHSLITDANGAMPPQEESDFYPYGGEIVVSGSDTNHYKFTGKERDAESGLDNFGARYNASSLGRFMTPDWAAKPTTVPYATFGDPQTLNLYTYVENAPLNRADADGHLWGSCVHGDCLGEPKDDPPPQQSPPAQNKPKTKPDRKRKMVATSHVVLKNSQIAKNQTLTTAKFGVGYQDAKGKVTPAPSDEKHTMSMVETYENGHEGNASICSPACEWSVGGGAKQPFDSMYVTQGNDFILDKRFMIDNKAVQVFDVDTGKGGDYIRQTGENGTTTLSYEKDQ